MINAIHELCKKYYEPSTYEHCVRVAKYACANTCVEDWDDYSITILEASALLHDIIEDTPFWFSPSIRHKYFEDSVHGDLFDEIRQIVEILTKDADETYGAYCQRIKDSNNEYAYVIKLADMKDHLSLTDTLTPRLAAKYLDGLRYLL